MYDILVRPAFSAQCKPRIDTFEFVVTNLKKSDFLGPILDEMRRIRKTEEVPIEVVAAVAVAAVVRVVAV